MCSKNRAGRYGDCPGGSWTQLQCCTMPNFYYGHCDKYRSGHGELNSCLTHGVETYILEGTCGSGANNNCDGDSVINDCCEGHLVTGIHSNILIFSYQFWWKCIISGENVGSNIEECVWMYAKYGDQLECGRSDEVVAGYINIMSV